MISGIKTVCYFISRKFAQKNNSVSDFNSNEYWNLWDYHSFSYYVDNINRI